MQSQSITLPSLHIKPRLIVIIMCAHTEETLRRISMTHEEKLAELQSFISEREQSMEKAGIADIDIEDVFRAQPENGRLINISIDPQASGSLVYFLSKPVVTVGTKHAEKKQVSIGDNIPPTEK